MSEVVSCEKDLDDDAAELIVVCVYGWFLTAVVRVSPYRADSGSAMALVGA